MQADDDDQAVVGYETEEEIESYGLPPQRDTESPVADGQDIYDINSSDPIRPAIRRRRQ